jgi:predicted O-methyltransferase YrrM
MIPRGQRTYLPGSEGWMTPSELDSLYEAAEETRGLPGGLLELGSYKGLSTSALALSGPVTCVDSFGGDPDSPASTRQDFERNMRSLGRWDLVTLVPRTTREGLAQLSAAGFRARLVLVDASHEEEDARLDMAESWPLIVPGGLLFVDDLDNRYAPGAHPGVHAAAARFERDHGVRFEKRGEWAKLAFAVKP